jgi:hypothetical protein
MPILQKDLITLSTQRVVTPLQSFRVDFLADLCSTKPGKQTINTPTLASLPVIGHTTPSGIRVPKS